MENNLPTNSVNNNSLPYDYITNNGRRFLLKHTSVKDLIIRRNDDLTIYQFHQTKGVVSEVEEESD